MSLKTIAITALLAALASAQLGTVQEASFTWYTDCDPGHLPACGDGGRTVIGTGFAATNRVTYEGGAPPVNGQGQGCGTCWHLQPQSNPYPMNGNTWGTPVVVKVNDECSDGGYCDQPAPGVGNSKYGKPLHFDLCVASGAADQFFGNRQAFGVLLGSAVQVDCAALTNGPFGSGLGNVVI